MAQSGTKKIAIACQGGGSHTAFTAGVLSVVLSPEYAGRFDLIGLSGTSGGAVCATLVWSGLISDAPDPRAEAVQRLEAFWDELKADTPFDLARNFWGIFTVRLPVVAEISPYIYAPFAEDELRDMLTRHAKLNELPADPARRMRPLLYIGVTDVLHGVTDENSVFRGETLTVDQVIASAAIPPVFRAIKVGHSLYWDGLFSRNPPLREFTDLPRAERPDEVWIVRINPQTRQHEPRSMPDIIDRRNELSGNLALDQERAFIEKINALLAKAHEHLRGDYKHIEVREIALDLPDLDYASKLDRSPELIDRLMQHGRQKAKHFLGAWAL
jgi:NTE family protein